MSGVLGVAVIQFVQFVKQLGPQFPAYSDSGGAGFRVSATRRIPQEGADLGLELLDLPDFLLDFLPAFRTALFQATAPDFFALGRADVRCFLKQRTHPLP